MNIFEGVRIAGNALLAHKLRTILTMLGIIIGVGAVIGMMAIGNGYTRFVNNEFASAGVGVFFVTPGNTGNRFGTEDDFGTEADFESEEDIELEEGIESEEDIETEEGPSVDQLTTDDAAAIMRSGRASAVASISVEYTLTSSPIVSAGRDRYAFPVRAVSPTYFTMRQHDLGSGRFFTPDDDNERRRVVILGRNIADTLFDTPSDAVGQRITLDGVTFEVIAVLTNAWNAGSGNSFSDPLREIYIPYQTGRSRLFRNAINSRVDIDRMTVKATQVDQVDLAIEQVTAILRERHQLDPEQQNGFSIDNPREAAEQSAAIDQGLNAFLMVVASISLFVGGVGVMNIMLVSVAQRSSEIGLRKAVGARQGDILFQFLVEAVVICLIGCAVGIAFGYGLSYIGTWLLTNGLELDGARAVVSGGSILLATLVSTLTGIVFGFFPAWRAARLHPIEALRMD